MGKRKTDEWKSRVEELIRNGKNFKSINETLLQEHLPTLGGSTFRRYKASIFPEEMREGALSTLKERKKKKEEGSIMSVLTPKAWNKTKQKEVDESVIADVLNEALFHFIPCPNNGLKIEDVKEINVGGSLVGLVVYYTDINLNHPLVIFSLRTIMLVLKVRAMCFKVQEKVEAIQSKIGSLRKGEWHEPPPPEK